MEIEYSQCLHWFYRTRPEQFEKYLQSVSPKQIECKQWLVDELTQVPIEFHNIELFGGWYGYPLIDMLDQAYDIEYLMNIDCDTQALTVNRKFSRDFFHHDFVDTLCNRVEKYRKKDKSKVDLCINTSSEHMPDLPELIQHRSYNNMCVFALQSNNMFQHEEHTNCVNSEEELIEKSTLTRILYSGTKEFDNYTRYMVIGMFDRP